MRKTLIAAAAIAALGTAPCFAQSMRIGSGNAFTSDAKTNTQSITAKGANSYATGAAGSLDVAGGGKIGNHNTVQLKGQVGSQFVQAGSNATALAATGGLVATKGLTVGNGNTFTTDGKASSQTVQASGRGAVASGSVGGFIFH